MKLTTLAGLTLIVTSCSSENLPDFSPSVPSRVQQQQTSCFADSSGTYKLILAKNLLLQMAQYEIKYGRILRLKDLSDCEEELLALLIRYKAQEQQFNSFQFYDREDEAWDYLKKEAKADIRATLAD